MTAREAVERARHRIRDDETQVMPADAPPAVGSGNAGTFHLDGQRRVPPFALHRLAPTVPVCPGSTCPAWDRLNDQVGICLVDPLAPGPDQRGAYVVGESICPLGVQRIAADLMQSDAWVRYLQKRGGRARR